MMNKLHNLPPRVLIGLSGGADSVALLLLLLDSGVQASAVHVNHGLRGDDSDGDEAFVRCLCAEKNVPLTVYRAMPPENPSEGWAREVRYGFFRDAMRASGADALVLAHHRDDQAETLLLHLLRGSGLTGLTGMAADTTVEGLRILRPLLNVSRAEIHASLEERNQSWREDGSNADARYLRNALRLEVLPKLEQLIPGAAERIAATASLLSEDEAVLQSLTRAFLAAYTGNALPLDALQAQMKGLQRRILRSWWAAEGAPQAERSLSSAQTETLLSLLEAPVGSRCNLPGDWHGQRGWTHLHLVSQDMTGIPEVPATESSLLSVETFDGTTGDGQGSQAIPRVWLADCTVRSRQKGDYIRPFGSEGKQSLQDYFVNRRIDAPFRDCVPLLCRGSEVLLAGGVGAGHVPRTNECDDPVLLRWREAFPWQRSKRK